MASSMYQPRLVVSSNPRYPHAPGFIDTRRTFHAAAMGDVRLPLRESNGNSQSPTATTPGTGGFPGLVSCYQSPVASTPTMLPPHPHAQPPMVPSQSFDCLQRLPVARQPGQAPHRYHQPLRGKARHAMNPLYYWPAFRQYRNRQAHKDTQKDKGGVWRRPELEDAFVDSVLLMPHMGRRKFSMGGKLHGRNMLISEYIFVICIAVLGDKEIFRIDNSNDSIEQMGRKQVSSHMQVVKKFFEDLRCFHFLFPAEEKREPGTTNSDDFYEEEEQESFKSNPVLTALAEGRVPEVKPNYEYFSQLLALQSAITVRPKYCEIYVSSPDVKVRDGIAYDSDNQPLDQQSFPHLNKYLGCDDTPKALEKEVLLHEYTQNLDRTTSACVRTVTRRWQKDAPALYDTLDLPQQDDECLLLEMCSTVELHEHPRFPLGAQLTGFVEVAVLQPALQNHRWKCLTRLTRPPELCDEDDEEGNGLMYTNESGIHRRGCGDVRPECDCHLGARSEIPVPFPAVEWASILSRAASLYPDLEHRRKEEKKHGKDRKHGVLGRSSSKRKRSDDEGDASAWTRREPSGSDLICRVAMYQELWSCAPDSNRWTRQAIIFWRFNTTNQWYKYNPVFRPAGTIWRWLTVNDPMSRYHQTKALVYPSSSLPRDAVMSPTPSVSQQLTATMSENFHQAWPGVPPMPPPHGGAGGAAGMGFLDSFSSGLVTPPPSATLPGSYSNNGSFDGSNSVGGYLPPSTCGPNGQALASSSQPYFDGTGGGGGSGSGGAVPPYIPGPLDLSGHFGAYDGSGTSSSATPQANGHGHGHGHIDGIPVQGWDMATLDGWQSASANTPVAGTDWMGPSKMDSQIWNPVHWSSQGGGGVARDESPGAQKRRRTENFDNHGPLPDGWQS